MYFFYYVPVGINAPLRRFPVVTWAYAAICAALFAVARFLPAAPLDPFDLVYIPGATGPLNAVTAAFVHFGSFHLIGNLLYMILFGRYVEDRLGPVLYTFLFVMSAAAGNLAQGYFNEHVLGEIIGITGASGAVSGMLGAFSVRFLRSRVRVAYWVFLPLQAYTRAGRSELPALVGILVWFGLQLASGLVQVEGASIGVAYATHVVGFITGVVVALLAGQYREGVVESTLVEGNRYMEKGQAYAAQGAYIRYLAARPHDGDVHARLARAMVISGNPPGAIRNYQTACERLLDSGRRGQAESVYSEALRASPGFVLEAGYQLSLAFGLERDLKIELAVRAYENFAARYPGHAEAPFVLLRAGGAYSNALASPGRARECYTRLVEEYPDDQWVDFARDQLRRFPEVLAPASR